MDMGNNFKTKAAAALSKLKKFGANFYNQIKSGLALLMEMEQKIIKYSSLFDSVSSGSSGDSSSSSSSSSGDSSSSSSSSSSADSSSSNNNSGSSSSGNSNNVQQNGNSVYLSGSQVTVNGNSNGNYRNNKKRKIIMWMQKEKIMWM